MRIMLATISALALLGACKRNDNETGARGDNDRTGMDTVIQSAPVKDTTVIRADTNINVDTVKKTDNIKDARH